VFNFFKQSLYPGFYVLILFGLITGCNSNQPGEKKIDVPIHDLLEKHKLTHEYQLLFLINVNECENCYKAFYALKLDLGKERLNNALFLFRDLSDKEYKPVMKRLLGLRGVEGHTISDATTYDKLIGPERLSSVLVIERDAIVFNKPIKYLLPDDYKIIRNYALQHLDIDSLMVTTDYLAKTGMPIVPVIAENNSLYAYNKYYNSFIRIDLRKKQSTLIKSMHEIGITPETLLSETFEDPVVYKYYKYYLNDSTGKDMAVYDISVSKLIEDDTLLYAIISQGYILPAVRDKKQWTSCNKYFLKKNYVLMLDSLLDLVRIIKIPSTVEKDSSIFLSNENICISPNGDFIFETNSRTNSKKFAKYRINQEEGKLVFEEYIRINYPTFFKIYSGNMLHSSLLTVLPFKYNPLRYYFAHIPYIYDLNGRAYKLPFSDMDTVNFDVLHFSDKNEYLNYAWPSSGGLLLASTDPLKDSFNFYLVDYDNYEKVEVKFSIPRNGMSLLTHRNSTIYALKNIEGTIWLYAIHAI